MKKCLPDTTKVSKDAKECVQECTSEFISFITSEAAERCQLEKRKTINGEDILFALHALGFDEYGVVMKVYLSKYREVSSLSPSLLLVCYQALTEIYNDGSINDLPVNEHRNEQQRKQPNKLRNKKQNSSRELP